MPLRLNVGLTRKVGLPEYSSVGASCHIEIELDSILVDQPEALRAKARGAYAAYRQAVNDELDEQRAAIDSSECRCKSKGLQLNVHRAESNSVLVHSSAPVSRNGTAARPSKPATPAQIRAIHAIAKRHAIDLPTWLGEQCGVKRAEALSAAEASRVIDALQDMTEPIAAR
jgi:hypothetical protein